MAPPRGIRSDFARWRARRAVPASPRPSGPAPRVAILGAGMSGMCAAIKLREAGIEDITILDRSDGVGGTWRDNHYPGSACDVPSHLYSFSFARNPDWSRKFSPQSEILAYFEKVARDYDLLPLCRFGVEVTRATWDEGRSVWRVDLAEGEPIEAEVFIAATGQLNRPYVPDLPGLDSFEGTTFHSARWDHDHDLSGERVAVVGNGASAVQFVPHVVRDAAAVTVYQRSANWIIEKPDREFRPWERFAFRHVPGWDLAYRFSIWARFETRFTLMRRKSLLRKLITRLAVPEYEKLVAKGLPRAAVIPDYPIGCKRILISNDYWPALLQPSSEVVTNPIARIHPHGVETADGTVRPTDAIIFGTGFETTKFLTPIEVRGRDGVDLHEEWAKGASAHLGMSISGFPNLFVLYGPNTNLGHNSIIFMTERQVEYVVQCVADLWRSGAKWMDVRPEVMQRSDAEVQRLAEDTVWVAGCDSWYKTEEGRLTNNWPDHTYNYWRATLDSGIADYEVSRA